MERKGALLAVCFCAGLLGGLINSLAVWAAGMWDITTMAGVAIEPALNKAWLYSRLVWGGIWGLVFYPAVSSPRRRNQWIRKGLWVSLLPSLVQLLYIFPQAGKGYLGLELGNLTPLFVLLFNFIWGAATGIFTRIFWGR